MRRVAPAGRKRSREPHPRHAGEGDRRLQQRSYETKEGDKRSVYELQVDEVGPSLRSATAKVAKVTRTSDSNGGQRRAAAPAPGGYSEEPPF